MIAHGRRTPLSSLVAFSALLVLTSLSAACSSMRHQVTGGTSPRCDSIRAAVASMSDLPGATEPIPRDPVMPPYPAPASAQGHNLTVRALVSERGRVAVTGVEVEGKDDYLGWAKDFAAAFARTPFEPARYQGCAVPRWFTTIYNIENH